MWLFLDLSPLYFSLCSNEIPWKQLVEVVSSLCVYCFLNHAVTSQHLTEWWVKFVLKWKKWWLINLSRSALVNNWTACVSDTWSIQSPRQAELSAHYHQTSVIIHIKKKTHRNMFVFFRSSFLDCSLEQLNSSKSMRARQEQQSYMQHSINIKTKLSNCVWQ